MYKILGSDQKEYGPVTAEQVREWLAQRRLNAQSLVQHAPGILPGPGPETRQVAGGTPEWIPLSACPEFATALTAPPAYAAATVATAAAAPDNPVSVIEQITNH